MGIIKKTAAALFALAALITAEGTLMAGTGVFKQKLDNGVTVIIQENHSAPVAACNFWLRVGAAAEGENEKGMTHFIEHMLFKGTKNRPVGAIDREIKELGGYNNAFTSYDATNYVIVLPSDRINEAIDIQYDALTGSVFDPAEVDKEREVIITELKRGLDNPGVFLWQKLFESTFDKYYKDPIIGYEEKLKNYTRDQLFAFFNKYYTADNLVVVVSGDVDTQAVFAHIKETFGKMDRKGNRVNGEGSFEQTGFRYSALSGPIEGRYMAVSFRVPEAISAEMPAIEILARAMCGSESSPMYRKIKEESQLVDSIESEVFSGRYGGIFTVTAQVREGKYGEALDSIFREIALLKQSGMKESDVQKVKADLLREEEKEKMKVENMAGSLGYFEVLKDVAYYDEYYDTLKRATTGDVNTVLNKYLSPENAVIVVYYPDKSEKEFAPYKSVNAAAVLAFNPVRTPEAETGAVEKKVMPNGITLIHKRITNTSIVSAKFLFKGGVFYEGGDSQGDYRGVTNLMLETMMKGTKKRTAAEIAGEIDSLGAIVGKDISKDVFGFEAESVNSNFPDVFELTADIILNPVFDTDETAKEKEDILNYLKRIKDSPAALAGKIFDEELFEWHPYGFFIEGDTATLKRINAKKLKAWHAAQVKPGNLIISVAGNITMDEAEQLIQDNFKGWAKSKVLQTKLPVKITGQKKSRREKTDKNQVHMLIGFLGPKTSGGDYFAFRVMDNILSGGMDSRLFTELREKRNLCYTVFSAFDRYVENGAFRVYTATSPENEQAAKEQILAVLKNLYDNGVTEKEVADAKTYIKGMYKVGMQDYMALADSYAMYEIWGLGYKMVDDFPGEIDKITKADVDKVIKKYFKLDKYCEVTVGPNGGKKK